MGNCIQKQKSSDKSVIIVDTYPPKEAFPPKQQQQQQEEDNGAASADLPEGADEEGTNAKIDSAALSSMSITPALSETAAENGDVNTNNDNNNDNGNVDVSFIGDCEIEITENDVNGAKPNTTDKSPPPPTASEATTTSTPTSSSDIDITITETSIPSSIDGDNFCIPLKIFVPRNNNNKSSKSSSSTPKIRAAALFIHGGIFSHGDRHCHPTISSSLASKLGMVVATCSFRNGKEAPHKSNITMRDLSDVVEYVRKHEEWGELPFGLVGSSSGGFFALTLAQTLANTTPIAFCIPICPVADPFKRASYLRSSISGSARSDGYDSCHDAAKSSRMLETQMSFWSDDASMMEAGESTRRNGRNVPTLLIIGSADKNVPFAVTKDVQSWATRTIVIGGKGHELCDEVDKGGGYNCYLPDIDRFLQHCLSLRRDNDDDDVGVESRE